MVKNVSWAAYGFLKDNGIDKYSSIPNINVLAHEIAEFFKDIDDIYYSGKSKDSRLFLENMLELNLIYLYKPKPKIVKKKKVKQFDKGKNYRKFVKNNEVNEIISTTIVKDCDCKFF